MRMITLLLVYLVGAEYCTGKLDYGYGYRGIANGGGAGGGSGNGVVDAAWTEGQLAIFNFFLYYKYFSFFFVL